MKDFDENKHELNQCFFGQHLKNESDIICLVESEKTALLCAGLFKKTVWMATGGRTQLNALKIMELGAKKRLILFPDADSVVFWSDKVKSLMDKFKNEKKVTTLEKLRRECGLLEVLN